MTKETQTQASVDSFMSLLRNHENRISETFGVLQDLKIPSEEVRAAIDASSEARNALIAEVERLAAQAAPTEAEYNPLLIDGVQHDPLCLKVYRSPLKECDCGASSRAAQPSQAPVVQAVQAVQVTLLKPAIWIESGMAGDRHIMVQYGDDAPFEYAALFYRYGYTDNATIHRAATEIAVSIGASEPVEERQRQIELAAQTVGAA